MRRIRQAGAIVALLALLAGVPWVMAATIGNPLNGWGSLKSGDLSDSVVIDVLAAVVWIAIWVAWLQFAVAVVAAVNTALRTSRRPLAGGTWAARPDLSAARVPGEFTGIPHLARWLVAAALLVGTAATIASTPARAFAAGHAPATVVAAAQAQAVAPAAAATPTDHFHRNVTTPATSPSATRTYVVPNDGSGPDTYWDIATAMLGSGERWHEIWALNDGRTQADGSVMTQAGLLMPGWTVLVPAQAGDPSPAASTSGDVVTVKPHDNLTAIADSHGATEPAVWARNEGRTMSDGRVFSDPNLIRPGDTIIIPGPAGTTPTHTTPTTPGQKNPTDTPGRTTPRQPGGRTPTTTPTPGSTTPAQPTTPAGTAPTTHAPQAQHPEHQQRPAAQASSNPWGDVFAGFGGVLAAGLLGALIVRRRMSWRAAQLGRTIASTPTHLVPAEKATLTHGSAGAPDGQFLDFALRSLAQATAAGDSAALPDVLAARMTGEELQLRLAERHPSTPPAPWSVDESGLWWSVSVGADLSVSADNAADVAAPYPTLVGVGYLGAAIGEDVGEPEQTHSEKWLVDLERAGAVALTGDADRCLDLGRFIAAGLAVNDWSHHVTVTMVGFGDELVAINPARLRFSDDLDAATALLAADYAHSCAAASNGHTTVLGARVEQVALDSFMPHVLLVAPHVATDHEKLNELLGQLAARPDRASVAIVLAGDRSDMPAAGWVLHVDDAGRLSLPELGTELLAQSLPREQAHDIAEMLHRAGEGQEEAVPPASGSRPWEQFIDAAGSLRAEYTLPRTTERHGPALVNSGRPPGPADLPAADQLVGASSVTDDRALDDSIEPPIVADQHTTTLLPADDEAYLNAAATTAEDLEVVAPRVPADVGARVAETVSGLDEALASWRDPRCALPRLTLLGPVELRAHGQTPQRIPYYTEVAAYLASRDHGAQIDQVAEAFGVKNETAASRLKDLRQWLGTNPRTGEMHLPDARKSKASRERGVSVYEVEDMLVDADLFQQLHLRGQARGGAAGIADLEAALELVIGEPYSQQRTGGYAWLRDNPVDEYLKVAVEKVAHTVASWALERRELDRAERAAKVALEAMPYAEVPRLDLAAVLEARGSKEAAERLLREEVCNRDDDGNGPLDLSDRTEQIRRRREWLSAS